MVRLRDEAPPSPEVVEYIPMYIERRVTNREIYKTFLKQLLEDFLPPHDRAQDELVEKLPRFIFLPDNPTPAQMLIYEKLCQKKMKLLRLQQERDELTMWLWAFYNEEFPDVTHEQCQEQEKKLVAGKQRFYRVGKQLKKWLLRMQSVYRH
ncbi:hypothetical protein PYW08_010231 [Mythimna loreyi]|uniref:Uncharacterized protein n=1 Tax=Mythimna loreyi TaxID=667449 RepID=A0ACC2Q7N5_9NEOP|nr:hypothetical protein PYW08_010231 [Mythimna loreyi]